MFWGDNMEGYIKKMFPEIDEIHSKKLKDVVVKIWCEAMEKGKWKTLDNIPFTLLIPDVKKTLVEHTRTVTRMAVAIAKERKDLNYDLVIAGGLTHDVGKLLEYEKKEGRVIKSSLGKRIRHPVSGAALALEIGLDSLAHIIVAHSKEGEFVERSAEAIIIYHCDFTDFEIEKTKVKK